MADSTLAVIATFYRRPWAVPKIADALLAQTRKPDEVYLIYEDEDDFDGLADIANEAVGWCSPHRKWDPPTRAYPRRIDPGPHNPLSVAINDGLVGTAADYIAYLTDDSLPDPRKYEVMARALDENPDWGIVYCSQDYGTARDADDWLAGGTHRGIRQAHPIEDEPFCVVDHTQVMHRRTKARWPLDRSTMRLSDAHFWMDLVADLGPMHGIVEVLDWTRQLPDGLSTRG